MRLSLKFTGKTFIKALMRSLALLLVLSGIFLVYSVMKIKTSQSVSTHFVTKDMKMPLYLHVEHLSVKIGSRSVYEYEKINAAKKYIVSCLEAMGYAPELENFLYKDRVFSNVIVTIPGKKNPEEIVIIGAHYDTVTGTPGADDNASAVAMLLETGRHLKDEKPGRTIRLIFFTLEEPPVFGTEFMGSAVHARAAKNKKENIVAMISLEMLGYFSDEKGAQNFPLPFMSLIYPTTPNFIAVVGNFSSRGLVGTVAASLRKKGGVKVETLSTLAFVPGVDFSDHRSFWEEGYSAVMITDTAFYRNPNYHTARDTIETLDFQRMNALLPALVQAVKDLGEVTPP